MSSVHPMCKQVGCTPKSFGQYDVRCARCGRGMGCGVTTATTPPRVLLGVPLSMPAPRPTPPVRKA